MCLNQCKVQIISGFFNLTPNFLSNSRIFALNSRIFSVNSRFRKIQLRLLPQSGWKNKAGLKASLNTVKYYENCLQVNFCLKNWTVLLLRRRRSMIWISNFATVGWILTTAESTTNTYTTKESFKYWPTMSVTGFDIH